jgi:hypothetical protein
MTATASGLEGISSLAHKKLSAQIIGGLHKN